MRTISDSMAALAELAREPLGEELRPAAHERRLIGHDGDLHAVSFSITVSQLICISVRRW